MDKKIILASGSPRRREMMDRLGLPYTVITSDKEEDMSGHVPVTMVKMLSRMKAEDVFDKTRFDGNYRNCVIIGCDTVVAHKGSILGKPHSEQEAYDMLRSLSGDAHQVYTGVCILVVEEDDVIRQHNFDVCTDVSVCELTDDEINKYIASGEPMDKAGAYAIQGLFAPYVTGISGDYYNIVGFPISRIYAVLKQELTI